LKRSKKLEQKPGSSDLKFVDMMMGVVGYGWKNEYWRCMKWLPLIILNIIDMEHEYLGNTY